MSPQFLELKENFVSVMKDDLTNHTSFELVSETSKQLEEKYEVQVHPREINLFNMTDSSRERIIDDERKNLEELETSPEKFSPNVVLRPLYQEFLLPNIAVVGGPAEVAYWLQYKKMFEHYKVNFPMLVLRKSFLLPDEHHAFIIQHSQSANHCFIICHISVTVHLNEFAAHPGNVVERIRTIRMA